MNYSEFIQQKTHLQGDFGFAPLWMPDMLFDFQKSLVEWAMRKGRAAIFADCGLGKSAMQLTIAENIVRKTGKRVLILTPLAVTSQLVHEGEKFGVECVRRKDSFKPSDRIVVTNYERLHHFHPQDFQGGVMCDESSILKNHLGKRSKHIIRFINKLPYRGLFTATASPNDYPELGTSSEALGVSSYSDMLQRFFRQLDDKGQKKALKEQREAEKASKYYRKLSFRVSQTIGQWRLKNYAVNDFWKWVSSWARACRKPSDLGFSDNGFILPLLHENIHIVKPSSPPDGYLFTLPAIGGYEEREERKRTLPERVEMATYLANHTEPVVIWCHYNPEGNALEKAIHDAVQIKGSTSDDDRERIYEDFAHGNLRALVIKPKIGAWGLNWQHCAHVVTFATHSYEQDYQSIRRCWRFGQKRPVVVDRIVSEGERRIAENLENKAMKAEVMFEKLIQFMNAELIAQHKPKVELMEVPTWL